VLDPFSILVPFLVFAIGVSHGAQKMNGVMQDIGREHIAWWLHGIRFDGSFSLA